MPVDAGEFARSDLARIIARSLPNALKRLAEVFAGSAWQHEVRRLIERYGGVCDARGLFEVVVAHHEETQRGKPPDGKRPWLEPLRGGYIARPQYAGGAAPEGTDDYAHDYRSGTASFFLQDLRKLPL